MRRCVERAVVVADHERHVRAGKAFNMHNKTIRWCPHGPTHAVYRNLRPKKGRKGWSFVEALRLRKFRASVPSGSPLFFTRSVY
jgi:hypothetical protein